MCFVWFALCVCLCCLVGDALVLIRGAGGDVSGVLSVSARCVCATILWVCLAVSPCVRVRVGTCLWGVFLRSLLCVVCSFVCICARFDLTNRVAHLLLLHRSVRWCSASYHLEYMINPIACGEDAPSKAVNTTCVELNFQVCCLLCFDVVGPRVPTRPLRYPEAQAVTYI